MARIIQAYQTDPDYSEKEFKIEYNLTNGEDHIDRASTADGSMQVIRDHESRVFDVFKGNRSRQVKPGSNEWGWLKRLFYG